MRVGKLNDAELLLLSRRRAGLRQSVMAASLGVGMRQYRRWEEGVDAVPHSTAVLAGIPAVEASGLTDLEKCVILRVRTGITRAKLARKIGVSPTWVTQMERGLVSGERLVEYWSTRAARR